MVLISKNNQTDDMDYINSVCKIGQREKCCRYLVLDSKGFECAKESETLKLMIDKTASTMNAKSDNCAGYLKRLESN